MTRANRFSLDQVRHFGCLTFENFEKVVYPQGPKVFDLLPPHCAKFLCIRDVQALNHYTLEKPYRLFSVLRNFVEYKVGDLITTSEGKSFLQAVSDGVMAQVVDEKTGRLLYSFNYKIKFSKTFSSEKSIERVKDLINKEENKEVKAFLEGAFATSRVDPHRLAKMVNLSANKRLEEKLWD